MDIRRRHQKFRQRQPSRLKEGIQIVPEKPRLMSPEVEEPCGLCRAEEEREESQETRGLRVRHGSTHGESSLPRDARPAKTRGAEVSFSALRKERKHRPSLADSERRSARASPPPR